MNVAANPAFAEIMNFALGMISQVGTWRHRGVRWVDARRRLPFVPGIGEHFGLSADPCADSVIGCVDDEKPGCRCGQVVQGSHCAPDGKFTSRGSYWRGGPVAMVDEAASSDWRDGAVCREFPSLAIVPLRRGPDGKADGLIHLAHDKENGVGLREVETIELLGEQAVAFLGRLLEKTAAEKRKSFRILFADDDGPLRDIIAHTLRALGFSVATAADGEEAWAMVQRDRYDVVVTDLRMPRLDGLTLARRIRAAYGHYGPAISVLTGIADEIDESSLQALDISSVLEKPGGTEMLPGHLDAILKDREGSPDAEDG